MVRTARTHDIVLFGATSFVGQILTKYMVDRHGSHGDVTWAMAGRNANKLAEVAAATGAEVDRITVDADDADGLAEMCAHTNLVISTVGPYALYGSKLVAAVVEAGIDYIDLWSKPAPGSFIRADSTPCHQTWVSGSSSSRRSNASANRVPRSAWASRAPRAEQAEAPSLR